MKGRIPESHQLDEDDNGSLLSSLAATSSSSPLLAFLKSNPLIIVIAALAAGVYFGMKHQSQGVDLADSVSSFLHEGRSDSITARAPTLATPSLASSSQQEQHMAGTPMKARKKQRQSKQEGQECATTSRLALFLSRNVTVHICRNGQSIPMGTLYLTPSSTRCLDDLRNAVGDLLPACVPGACRLFDRYGYEIKALGALQDEQLLFAVLPKRHFMWPAFEVGHKVAVPGVTSSIPGQPITLETLSESPRVFLVENFLSPQDAEDLIENALGITAEGFALKRSTTGAEGSEVSSQRTSENAFDTTSPIAMKLKRRVFDLLGMRPYVETWADGLQVLRYNESKAYISHLDYLEVNDRSNHDFDSAREGGTNRFATVLLYLTDVEQGGETVFPHGYKLEGETLSKKEALAKAKALGLTAALQPGSWQEEMMGECINRLAVKPKKARAVLFYSQNEDGTVDKRSLHGACPVIKGVKWAANLWVWNGPRYGYSARQREKAVAAAEGEDWKGNGEGKGKGKYKGRDGRVEAEFSSSVGGVALFWEETRWGEMGPGLPAVKAITYQNHKWNVRREEGGEGGEVLVAWEIKTAEAVEGVVKFNYAG
ncbi:Hypothetical protein NocV09_01400340 [Nannochloropsis oceanica]